MYWQKYFQLYYSNDTVRLKEAKINVKGTDPFNQTWHKLSLGEGDSSLFKLEAVPFTMRR